MRKSRVGNNTHKCLRNQCVLLVQLLIIFRIWLSSSFTDTARMITVLLLYISMIHFSSYSILSLSSHSQYECQPIKAVCIPLLPPPTRAFLYRSVISPLLIHPYSWTFLQVRISLHQVFQLSKLIWWEAIKALFMNSAVSALLAR